MTKKYRYLTTKKLDDLTIRDMVYLNACECIYYGYGYGYLNKCGLGDFTAKVIYNEALADMGNED